MSDKQLNSQPLAKEAATLSDPTAAVLGSEMVSDSIAKVTAGAPASAARSASSAPKVYDYSNYRLFLADWLNWKKSVSPAYSGSIFARKAGLQSHTLFGMVVRGKRNLGSSTIRAFAKAMGLRGREELYFERLVLFNQSTASDDKAFYFEQMQLAWQGERNTPLLQLKYHASYLKHWHVVAIREMVGLEGFDPDPDWICRKLKRKINRREAEDAWSLLQKIGMIEVIPTETADGKATYKILNPAIDFHAEPMDFAVRKFHREYLKRAQEAIDGEPVEDRDFSSLTIAVSDEDFVKLKDRIKEFRQVLNREFTHSAPARNVIAVNMQLLSLTSSEKANRLESNTTENTSEFLENKEMSAHE